MQCNGMLYLVYVYIYIYTLSGAQEVPGHPPSKGWARRGWLFILSFGDSCGKWLIYRWFNYNDVKLLVFPVLMWINL